MREVVYWTICGLVAIPAFLAIAERRVSIARHFLTFFLFSTGGIFLFLNNVMVTIFYFILLAVLVFFSYFRLGVFKTKDMESETMSVGWGRHFLSSMFGIYLFFVLLTIIFAGDMHGLKFFGFSYSVGFISKNATGFFAPMFLVLLGFFITVLGSFRGKKL